MLLLLTLIGCAELREAPESWAAWFDSGDALDVTEPILFEEGDCYGFPAEGDDGIAQLLADHYPAEGTNFPEEAAIPAGCDFGVDPGLPVEVEGVVTLHPRFYFKTSGCAPDSDEKYYGSYFIADDSGGVFVLGDSKVAHFDVGDRVRMRVRGVRTNFDMDLVYAHDILEVERLGGPVCFEAATEALGPDDLGRVRRVEGVVVSEADTFGELLLESEAGDIYAVGLDSELTRRGLSFSAGQRVQATGPVLLSYSIYKVVVMNVGQVQVLD